MTPNSRIRVLLASEHSLLRAGLRKLLEAEREVSVVGDAPDFEEAIRLTRRLKPDVAVLGPTSAPRPTVLIRLHTAWPPCRVLVLANHDDGSHARIALTAGAAGYLSRSATEQELVAAIRGLHDGQGVVDARLTAGGPRNARTAPGPSPALSRREKQVLELLARGHTNREVAGKLGVGVKTVETYRARLAEKLGLVNRADIVTYALEAGLLTPSTTESTNLS